MKKGIMIFLMALVLLTACSGKSKVPDGMSERAYTLGTKALSLLQDYNNGEITRDEAREQISEIKDRIQDLRDDENTGEYWKDLDLVIRLQSVDMALSGNFRGYNTFEEEQELEDLLKAK